MNESILLETMLGNYAYVNENIEIIQFADKKNPFFERNYSELFLI